MKYIKPIVFAILLIILDQITKRVVDAKLALGDSIALINNVFEIRYIRNEGAAWGILQGKQVFFFIITIIVIILSLIVFFRMYVDKKFVPLQVLIVLLLSGAIGNMIDRISNGYVIDFFYFKLIDFPVFNVADCYVTVSVILLIILIFFRYKDDDLDILFVKKGKKNKE